MYGLGTARLGSEIELTTGIAKSAMAGHQDNDEG